MSERGAVGGSETWVLGVAVFVVGTLLVAWAWTSVRARSDADAIAREYLRAFTEAPSDEVAWAEGDAAARRVADDRQVAADRIDIVPPTAFLRCTVATVTVRVRVGGLRLGSLGSVAPHSAAVTRSELTDAYRATEDGWEGEADDGTPSLCD
jgi:hypothetical protein